MLYSERWMDNTSSELWLTDSQFPHQTLLVKQWLFLSAENCQHIQAERKFIRPATLRALGKFVTV